MYDGWRIIMIYRWYQVVHIISMDCTSMNMMVYCFCCCGLLVSHLLAWVGTNTVRVSTRTPLSPASPAAPAQFPTRGEFNSGSSSSSCRKLSSLIFFCLTISPTPAAVSGSRDSSSRGSNRSSSSSSANSANARKCRDDHDKRIAAEQPDGCQLPRKLYPTLLTS